MIDTKTGQEVTDESLDAEDWVSDYEKFQAAERDWAGDYLKGFQGTDQVWSLKINMNVLTIHLISGISYHYQTDTHPLLFLRVVCNWLLEVCGNVA